MELKPMNEQRIAALEAHFDHCTDDDLIEGLSDPVELQFFAKYFNRDAQKHLIKELVQNPACDRGTAMYVYHSLEPGYFFEKYTTRDECAQWERDSWDIMVAVEDRISREDFATRGIMFNVDPYLEDYAELKRAIPLKLLKSNEGEAWPDPFDEDL